MRFISLQIARIMYLLLLRFVFWQTETFYLAIIMIWLCQSSCFLKQFLSLCGKTLSMSNPRELQHVFMSYRIKQNHKCASVYRINKIIKCMVNFGPVPQQGNKQFRTGDLSTTSDVSTTTNNFEQVNVNMDKRLISKK